jgi:hypothetical protein
VSVEKWNPNQGRNKIGEFGAGHVSTKAPAQKQPAEPGKKTQERGLTPRRDQTNRLDRIKGSKAKAARRARKATEPDMSTMRLFAPISKVDEAKRTVYGRACQEMPDRADEIFDYRSSVPYFKEWSASFEKDTDGRSLGNLRAMHGKVAAGKITAIDFNDTELAIDVAAKIVDDGEWSKVLEGVYTGFSIGGSYVGDRISETIGDKTIKRYTAKPAEISLVDSPCIPTARFFDVVKADGAIEKRAFRPPEFEVQGSDEQVAEFAKLLKESSLGMGDVIALLKAKAKADEDEDDGKDGEDGKDGDGKDGADAATPDGAIAEHAHGKTAAAMASSKSEDHAAAAHAHRAAETHFDGKNDDDAAEHHGQMAAYHEQMASHKFAEAAGMLKALFAKREFSADERKAAAKAGHALPDGSFPINSVADLHNAVQAFGRAKDKAAAKAHIIKRAKALGATDALPDSWKAEKDGEKLRTITLKKGIWNVSQFAECLSCLADVCRSAEFDLQAEGDDSGVPAKLRNCLDDLIEVFKEMTEEEADEMLAELKDHAGVGEDDEIEQAVEAAMAIGALRKRLTDPELPIVELAKICGEHEEPCNPAALADMPALVKRLLAKAGARHSKLDMQHLQAAHDHLADLGADCSGSEKAAKGGELNKAVSDELAELRAKVKKLEDQPVPFVTLRTVGKTIAGDPATPTNQPGAATPMKDLVHDPDGRVNMAATVALNS